MIWMKGLTRRKEVEGPDNKLRKPVRTRTVIHAEFGIQVQQF